MSKVSFRTLQKRMTEARTKSDIKLSAQSPELCSLNKNFTSDLMRTYTQYYVREDLIPIEKAVIELLMLNGLRISEVLSIKPSDVLPNGYIRINGKKGSNDRLITSNYFRTHWQTSFISLLPLHLYYSRFYFYRLFKKIGIYGRYGSNKYNSVTHYFRHEIVLSMQKSGVDDQLISEFLGHKSSKSLLYYVGKKV